ADPENREFRHPDPIGWTEAHRAEILRAMYAILLGNPALDLPRDAPMRTRFKMWYRLIGSALEHGAKCAGHELDFSRLFLDQEEDDEESASLGETLDLLSKCWIGCFKASDVAKKINDYADASGAALRDFFYPGAPPNHTATPKSVGRLLKAHLDEPVVWE